MSKRVVYVINSIVILIGVVSLFPAIFTPMMFDAPGSQDNLVLIVIAIAVFLFPFICLVSTVTSFKTMKRSIKKAFYIAIIPPIADSVLIIILSIILDQYCGGSFSCQV